MMSKLECASNAKKEELCLKNMFKKQPSTTEKCKKRRIMFSCLKNSHPQKKKKKKCIDMVSYLQNTIVWMGSLVIV